MQYTLERIKEGKTLGGLDIVLAKATYPDNSFIYNIYIAGRLVDQANRLGSAINSFEEHTELSNKIIDSCIKGKPVELY